jgi:PiT family inorganic phosphate transporter
VEIITEHYTVLMGMAVVFGLFMTWGIGANDVANAMGTSIGAKAITVTQAIFIAAVFEFAGAFLAGGHVTKTIRKGIIDPSMVEDPETLVFGMLASLLAAGIWLLIASAKGWPVSTTHTIVGAIVGFAVVGIGVDSVNWSKISQIALSWVVSPLIGGALALALFVSVQRLVLTSKNPFESAQRYTPGYLFLLGFIISLVTIFKGLKHINIDLSVAGSIGVAVVFGAFVAAVGRVLIKRVKAPASEEAQYKSVERVFTPMMIFTACAMAFAHGSNDVANGIGPLAAVVSILDSAGQVAKQAATPNWILLLGGGGIVVGLATLGARVMRTIGEKITLLTPTRGFCANLATASTVVLASRTGLPVSTTHVAVGAVIGVGLARGLAGLDLRVVGSIAVTWVVTLPIGAFLAAFFYFTLRGMFL